MSHLDFKKQFQNNDPSYAEYFRLRGVKKMNQYGSGIKLKYPDSDSINKFRINYHYWSQGDSYYKLAEVNYGNPDHWWVIAYYNQIPIEQEITTGQQIEIPFPIQMVIEAMRA